MEIDLIYCADGNSRFAQIAIEHGFLYGAQLPATIYHDPYFVDQDWKNPNREKYMACLEKYRPKMASVLDWEQEDQLPEVLSWAEEAAAYVEYLVIIPKIPGTLDRIPDKISGTQVRLGYSVPTSYGGTPVPSWEFGRRPVHLLGGSPQKQMKTVQYMNVLSADGNMAHKMATTRCQFWVPGHAYWAKSRWWPTLLEADRYRWENDAPYEAFRRSCVNIMNAWIYQ